MTKRRSAQCHCGQLQAHCDGEPLFVAMCHCQACQRRTGSSYNLGAWFEKTAVQLTGPSKVFERRGDSNMLLRYHFCPNCGSNVYWTAEALPEAFGIAAGCFADATFPAPTLSCYEIARAGWVQVPADIPQFEGPAA